MYKIAPISPSTLQAFYDAFEGEKTFLQSSQFGAWRESLGENVIYWGLYFENKLIGTALIQGIKSRFKSYLHCPHGPLINTTKDLQAVWTAFLEAYKNLGKEKKVDLIRIAPLLRIDQGQTDPSFANQGFRPAKTHLINPEHTLVLDITPDQEALLMQMRKSTRYEINRIGKSGISIEKGHDEKNLKIFWDLHTETVKRQNFVPFPISATKKELESFGENALIINSKIDQEYYSSAIILFDKESAYYQQGASRHCKLPTSHAVLWEAILEAKRRGCRFFNFWGVSPQEQTKHPWYGLSQFKRGFGGEEKQYLHLQDFEYTLKAKLNRFLELYRRWKRGY